jgi:hypothetical protein
MQAMGMRCMSYFALQKMLQTSNARAARYRFHFTCVACHALQLVKLLRRQLLEQNNIKADDDSLTKPKARLSTSDRPLWCY